MTPLQYS